MDVFARRRAQLAAARPHVNNVSGPGDVGRVLSLPRVEKHPPIVWRNFLNAGATGIKLRPIQEEALAAIAATDGGLFPIGVGHGKSLIALLAGTVLRADLAIVLVAPATVPQMGDWLRECKMHYRMPETLVVSWGRLSRPDASDWLTSLDVADKRVVLVADEAHFVRNPDAARTKRLMRWLKEHSHVKFVALSGTLTTRRLADFAHIAHRTLGKSSPLPIGPEGRVWDTVLAGEPYNVADLAAVVPLWKWATVTQSAQPPRGIITSDQKKALSLAFGERLRTCPGVVLTQDASCQSSLYLAAWTPDNVPKDVEQVWAEAERDRERGYDEDGEEFADDAESAEHARRLAFGFRYVWDWGASGSDAEWLEARRDWSRTCRALIKKYARDNFDTRLLVENEASRRFNAGDRSRWVMTWRAWHEIKDRANPVTVPLWITRWCIQQIVDKAVAEGPCIVWYHEKAVAEALADCGLLVKHAGEAVPTQPCDVALSIRSHGTGLNLQDRWHKQVFAHVPANGTTWEQVLGRTHRPGQPEDEVWAWVPNWTRSLREPFSQARRDAQWIQSSTSGQQRLMLGTYV